MLHMHMRGKNMKYEAVYLDGRRETLLWVSSFPIQLGLSIG